VAATAPDAPPRRQQSALRMSIAARQTIQASYRTAKFVRSRVVTLRADDITCQDDTQAIYPERSTIGKVYASKRSLLSKRVRIIGVRR